MAPSKKTSSFQTVVDTLQHDSVGWFALASMPVYSPKVDLQEDLPRFDCGGESISYEFVDAINDLYAPKSERVTHRSELK